MSKLAKETEPKLPTWFTQSFNERIVSEVTEELRDTAEVTVEHVEAPPQRLPEIDEERMAQFRADLHRRMEEIRVSQNEYEQPMPIAAPMRRTAQRTVRVAPKVKAQPVHKGDFSAAKTAGLVVAVLATGAGIGYLATFAQGLPTGFALFESAEQKVQALFAATNQPPASKTRVKSVVTASIAVADVSGAAEVEIPLKLVADQTNSTIIYKISGVPAEAYLTEGKQLPDGNWSLKHAELPDAKIVVGEKAPAEIGLEVSPIVEATGEIAAPAKPIKVAVEPPPNLEKGDIRIEPAASKPGNFDQQ